MSDKFRFWNVRKANEEVERLEALCASKGISTTGTTTQGPAPSASPAPAPAPAPRAATPTVVPAASTAPAPAGLDAKKLEAVVDKAFGAATFHSLKVRSSSDQDFRGKLAARLYAEGVAIPGFESDIAKVESKFGKLTLTGMARATAAHKQAAIDAFLK